jgi:hypothetical protein
MARNTVIAWRDAVVASDLPASSRLVLLVLSTHMNAAGGSCHPGTRRLAQESGLSRNTVLDALKACIDDGWLEVEPGIGRRTNAYTAALPLWLSDRATTDDVVVQPPRHNGEAEKPVVARLRSRSGAIKPRSGATTAPKDVEDVTTEDETHTSTALELVLADEPAPDLFEAFWTTWPRKANKPTARRAWNNAIKRNTPAAIIAAAGRSAEHWQTQGTERRYIPHPATWLNGDGWDDDLVTNVINPRATRAATAASNVASYFSAADHWKPHAIGDGK